jgi:hypothetical protein
MSTEQKLMKRKKKMKKIIILSFSLLLSFNIFAKNKQIKTVYNLRNHVEKIKKKELMNSLRLFVYKGKPNRFFASKGHKNFQDYLIATLKNYKVDDSIEVIEDIFDLNIEQGKKLYQSDFDNKVVPNFKPDSAEYKKWSNFKQYMHTLLDKYKSYPGKNFIWEKKGSQSDKMIIITAHYDTVSHDSKTLKIDTSSLMPGADYNVSGVIIGLSLVKLLHDQDLKHTVRIVFLDAQAIGFLGSYDYAQKLKKEKDSIWGVFNLEMLGHDSKKFDKKKKYKNYKVYARSIKNDPESKDKKLFDKINSFNKKASVNIKFELARNDFISSDNFRFWDEGIPAITFSQNWEDDFNPKYQTGNDFPETLNQESLYNSYRYIAQGVLAHLLDL